MDGRLTGSGMRDAVRVNKNATFDDNRIYACRHTLQLYFIPKPGALSKAISHKFPSEKTGRFAHVLGISSN